MQILNSLNEQQKEAVLSNSNILLVSAGAGSGKTSVLTKRITYQIKHHNVHPQNILAITFTNKAATEMKERISSLLESDVSRMWIGTFHGISNRILRQHFDIAKLNKDFQVLDSSDQLRSIKQLLTDLHVNQELITPKDLQKFINKQKESGLRSKDVKENLHNKELLKLYKAYEKLCFKTSLVDFCELMLRSFELIRDNPEIRIKYQEQFKHIFTDEFQDTNILQYQWIKQLFTKQNNLFCVFDSDQSIYSFRGSRPENIDLFKIEYPEFKLIKLEQNYRSTGNILKAANSVISYNDSNDEKILRTDEQDGDKISLYPASDDRAESKFIIQRILELKQQHKLKDFAILYRTNAQSRQFEEDLMSNEIPYKVHGGLRFYDRAEIKNALAYIRLVYNNHDDISFGRIYNVPTRGISSSTFDLIREYATDNNISLFQSTIAIIQNQMLPSRATNSLYQFVLLLESIESNAKQLPLKDSVEYILQHSGLLTFYENDKMEKSEEKIENLKELVSAASIFNGEMQEFLDHTVLESGDTTEDSDYIQLMTLHASKGLEFPVVFLVGLEENLFPSGMVKDDKGIEEERRLMYVGITRAMKKLFITYAYKRMLFGKIQMLDSSRFLREIPNEIIDNLKVVKKPDTQQYRQQPRIALNTHHNSKYKSGQIIEHTTFGKGKILELKGETDKESALIQFDIGNKWLMTSYL
jgi:DNA helicase-2/ATP-dependent DNA helicase PcrA